MKSVAALVFASLAVLAVGFAPLASTSRPALVLGARRVSGGPSSTVAPSADVDMAWTIEVIRDIMRENDEPVSSDDPNSKDPSFYDDWRNDPERADLVNSLADDQKEGGDVPPHPWEGDASPFL